MAGLMDGDEGEEYEDDYEEEEGAKEKEKGKGKGKGGVLQSLRRAAQEVDKENSFDVQQSVQVASAEKSRVSGETSPRVESKRISESIEEKMKRADATIDSFPASEEKERNIESDPESEGDDESTEEEEDDDDDDGDEYEEFGDFLICCYRQHLHGVRTHLERGANIRAVDRHGWTAVHWVCAKGYDDVLELLLSEYRGHIKKIVNVKDRLMGFTPLHLACIGGHFDCIRILLDNGAKKLKNSAGERPQNVVNVSLSSGKGKKIGKMLGIKECSEEAKQSRK